MEGTHGVIHSLTGCMVATSGKALAVWGCQHFGSESWSQASYERSSEPLQEERQLKLTLTFISYVPQLPGHGSS